MRGRIITTAAVLFGTAVAGVVARQLLRRSRNQRAARTFERAPVEAVIVFEEEGIDLGGLEGLSEAAVLAEAEAEAELLSEAEEGEREAEANPDISVATLDYLDERAEVRESGELYGAHTMTAVETEHPDDDRAQEHGENWIEALQTDAAEYGAEPEKVLTFLDEADIEHPSTDTRDRPVADHGSAGPRGL